MAAVQQPPLNVPGVKVPHTKIGQHAPPGHERCHLSRTVFVAATSVALLNDIEKGQNHDLPKRQPLQRQTPEDIR